MLGYSEVMLAEVWWKEQMKGGGMHRKWRKRRHNIQMADWDLVS